MTCDTWHVTCDKRLVTHDKWHATNRGLWTFSQNFTSFKYPILVDILFWREILLIEPKWSQRYLLWCTINTISLESAESLKSYNYQMKALELFGIVADSRLWPHISNLVYFILHNLHAKPWKLKIYCIVLWATMCSLYSCAVKGNISRLCEIV